MSSVLLLKGIYLGWKVSVLPQKRGSFWNEKSVFYHEKGVVLSWKVSVLSQKMGSFSNWRTRMGTTFSSEWGSRVLSMLQTFKYWWEDTSQYFTSWLCRVMASRLSFRQHSYLIDHFLIIYFYYIYAKYWKENKKMTMFTIGWWSSTVTYLCRSSINDCACNGGQAYYPVCYSKQNVIP